MRVAVDAMGGDHGPEPIVSGAIQGVREHGVTVVLVGDEERIRPVLAQHTTNGLGDHIAIHHAADVIRMDESGSEVLRRPDSSISRAAELVKEGKADAVVSMGNTGAAMVAGRSFFECIRGIKRPAIAVQLPTLAGRPALLIDAGATADCNPAQLVQFGLMGSVYSEAALGVTNPKVGLVSNGEEQSKGSKLYRDAFKLLEGSNLNFVGNTEPGALFAGNVDVLVCDGFVGNVVLKAAEGVAMLALHTVREAFLSGPWQRLVGWLAKPLLRKSLRSMRYDAAGGAVLLGLQRVLIVGHGRSNDVAVSNAIRVARDTYSTQVVDRIRDGVAALAEVTPESSGAE